jgi:3-hydroxyisobutyrate dehydrogenase
VSRPRVGFVGLGAMGSALAMRLAATTELTVFDLDPVRARPIVAAGARTASDLAALAAAVDTIITCLPTSRDVRSALDAMQPGTSLAAGALVIDCTSGDPAQTRAIAADLARYGIALVDAPVSGGPQAAAAGTIAILVGAGDDAFARAEPLLRLVSPAIRHVGGVGTGHCVKLLNNALAAGQRLLAFEALTIAVGQGVTAASFVDAVNVSSGRSYATEVTVPRHLLSGTLDQGFSLGLTAKDADLARALVPPALAGKSLIAEIAARTIAAARDLGPGTDVNRIIEIFERLTGTVVATSDRAPG